MVPPTSRPHISIDWCVEPNIKAHWMDRWYMVFDEDPHGNRDIPFYFLRKMYAEFILQKHVNYFDILDFQGVGHGMPQDRQGARTDPNHIRRPPRTPNPPRVYPPAGSVIVETQEALFDLTDTLLQHGTAVERNVGEGVGPPDVGPSRAGPSKMVPSRDKPSGFGAGSSQDTGTAHQVLGHPCTTCGNLCYGPSSDFRTDGLLQFGGDEPNVQQEEFVQPSQVVHHDSPHSHHSDVDLDDVEAAVNAAYVFGASPSTGGDAASVEPEAGEPSHVGTDWEAEFSRMATMIQSYQPTQQYTYRTTFVRQASSEAGVLEPHQVHPPVPPPMASTDPPPPSPHVHAVQPPIFTYTRTSPEMRMDPPIQRWGTPSSSRKRKIDFSKSTDSGSEKGDK